MRTVGFGHISVLAALLGVVVPAFGMQEQHHEQRQEQARPEQNHEQARPEQRHEEARPEQRQQPQARAPQGRPEQPRGRAPEQRPQQSQHPQGPQDRPQRADRQGQPGHGGGQRASWQDHRAGNFQSEHRSWQQRGGYHGYRVPDGRFRSRFGEQHRFRMSAYPMAMYGGHPRFRYGGLWLNVLDPWPETWAADWYGNDDVYIGFSDGGYYMYNSSYPGDQIALSISQ
ncbi:MAG: hypothetical protein P4L36_22045 [Holophaga sp.]|nr:hypothetical protein [Holophaga sp.]